MDIIDVSIGLDARPPYEEKVNNEFAKKAMRLWNK